MISSYENINESLYLNKTYRNRKREDQIPDYSVFATLNSI